MIDFASFSAFGWMREKFMWIFKNILFWLFVFFCKLNLAQIVPLMVSCHRLFGLPPSSHRNCWIEAMQVEFISGDLLYSVGSDFCWARSKRAWEGRKVSEAKQTSPLYHVSSCRCDCDDNCSRAERSSQYSRLMAFAKSIDATLEPN